MRQEFLNFGRDLPLDFGEITKTEVAMIMQELQT